MNERTDKAINILEEYKEIHEQWVKFQENVEDWKNEVGPEDLGTTEYYKEWIKKIDFVLEVLSNSGV